MPKKRIHQTYSVSLTASDMIHRVDRLLRRQAGLFFRNRKIDLTPEQWGLLLKLAEADGQSQTDLASPALNDHPNITRILDGLAKKGLIERTENPTDRRSALVFLTEKGKSLIDDLLPEVVEEKGKYYEGLTEKDIDVLRKILAAIENNILECH